MTNGIGSLAQLVCVSLEHCTFNAGVLGSNPRGVTLNYLAMRIEKSQFPPNTTFVFYPIYYTKEITEEELKAMQEEKKEDESSEPKAE